MDAAPRPALSVFPRTVVKAMTRRKLFAMIERFKPNLANAPTPDNNGRLWREGLVTWDHRHVHRHPLRTAHRDAAARRRDRRFRIALPFVLEKAQNLRTTIPSNGTAITSLRTGGMPVA
jgi:hypothetical protein